MEAIRSLQENKNLNNNDDIDDDNGDDNDDDKDGGDQVIAQNKNLNATVMAEV